MKKPIDLSPEKNIARDDAIRHAQARANRERKAMCIYVAPPEAPAALVNDGRFNNWYVRPIGEPEPEMAELYRIIAPTA